MLDLHRRRPQHRQQGWWEAQLGNFLEGKWLALGLTLLELPAPYNRVLFYDTESTYVTGTVSLSLVPDELALM
jgi:hypothetical protein